MEASESEVAENRTTSEVLEKQLAELKMQKEVEEATLKERISQLSKKVLSLEGSTAQLASNLLFKEDLNKQLSNDLIRAIEAKIILERELNELKQAAASGISAPLQPAPNKLPNSPHSDNSTEKSTEEKNSEDEKIITKRNEETFEELKELVAELKEETRVKDVRLTYMTMLLTMKEEEVMKGMYSCRQAQNEAKKAREEAKTARLDVKAIGDKVRILQEILTEADSQLSRQKNENKKHLRRIGECEEIMRRKEEEMVDCKRQIEERNAMLKGNESRYIEYEANKRQLETIIFNLKEQIRKLNQQNVDGVNKNTERRLNRASTVNSDFKYEEKISSLESLINEKNSEIAILRSEQSILEASLNEIRDNHKREEEELRLKVLKLEMQAIDNVPTSPDKSVVELQDEIKELKKKELELLHLLENEKAAAKLEIEKHKAIAKESNSHHKDKMLSEINSYIKELIEAHKTIAANSNKSIKESKARMQKLEAMSDVMAKMLDKEVTREKFQDIITSSLYLFPYLARFNLKTEIKFVARCFLKVIEHKLKKKDLYQLELEINEATLNNSEEKLKVLNNSVNTLIIHSQ
eukprot:TRINITY_DN4655_c0_g2_i2.p1 TRINITY_DN4655_c0_g2~~TRINITY_DN4655_c0_g2_i2.p1  ORF type:complete len:582 (-),score=197.99 TRINITY_DN4655_c0_g2_i2:102-1847(-)